ncbi:MAG: hypothetical protein ACE5EM_04580 [Sphingomonadales bacterium]
MFKKLASAAVVTLLPASATLAAQACSVSYEEFEEAVPHIDLAQCPGVASADDKGFCRLTIEGDKLFVYSFHFIEQDACLVDINGYSFAEFKTRFGMTFSEQ